MKFKSIILAGLAVWAVTATSCSDDPEYVPAAPVETPEAYFNPSVTYNFELGEDDTKVTINATRSDSKGVLEIPITSNCAESGIFGVPASVKFADGEFDAPIEITVDNQKMEGAKNYVLNVVIGDGADTPYFNLTCPVTFVYFPWVDVVGPNGEEFATYSEDVACSMYNFNGLTLPLEYGVKLQSSPAVKGLYRIVNPYSPEYSVLGASFTYDDSENHYLYFNAADPNKVFICNAKGQPNDGEGAAGTYYYYSGLTIQADAGEMFFTGYYNFQLARKGESAALPYAGKLVNGVLSFPEKAILVGEDLDPEGNLYYANGHGYFKVIWPGVTEEPAPEEVWESLGQAQYTDPFIYPLFGVTTPVTYPVEIEQSQEDPNILRLVNPYKEDVMPDGEAYAGDKYIYLDVTNPDCVLVPDLYATGFNDENDGETYIINKAGFLVNYQGQSEDDVIKAGFADTFKDGVITINAGNALANFPNAANPDDRSALYRCNKDIVGKIVLPSAAGTSSVSTTAIVPDWTIKPVVPSFEEFATMEFRISNRVATLKR